MDKCPKCGRYSKILAHKTKEDKWAMVCRTLTGDGCGYESEPNESQKELIRVVKNTPFYDPEECLKLPVESCYPDNATIH
jgi:hypothetical protein